MKLTRYQLLHPTMFFLRKILDSNQWYLLRHGNFQDCYNRPLCQPSYKFVVTLQAQLSTIDSRLNNQYYSETWTILLHLMSTAVYQKTFNKDLSWYHQESNLGHMDFQSIALPTELWYLIEPYTYIILLYFGKTKSNNMFFLWSVLFLVSPLRFELRFTA